jgi:hypothetical protein
VALGVIGRGAKLFLEAHPRLPDRFALDKPP